MPRFFPRTDDSSLLGPFHFSFGAKNTGLHRGLHNTPCLSAADAGPGYGWGGGGAHAGLLPDWDWACCQGPDLPLPFFGSSRLGVELT